MRMLWRATDGVPDSDDRVCINSLGRSRPYFVRRSSLTLRTEFHNVAGGRWLAGLPSNPEELEMKFNMWMAALLLGTACLTPSLSRAAAAEAAIKADNNADFTAVVAAVKAEMVAGGRYEFVSSSERNKIDTSLTEMQSFFDKFGTVAAMDKDSKFQLYVEQEDVNAILTRRDDRRMVCTSERPMGSLISKRTCRTYGAVERDRRNAQEEMIRRARPGYVGDSKNPAMLRAQTLSAGAQH